MLELKGKNSQYIQEKKEEAKGKQDLEDKKQKKIQKFYSDLEESHDLNDNLQELSQFLYEFTGATGVYVGKLEHPRITIEDKDNDRAHIDREAPKVIKYKYASP